MRVAVIGVGSMGFNHLRVYSELDGVQLVGISDVSAERLETLKSRFQVSAYTDYRKLIENEKPDAVSITVPTSEHEQVATFALRAGVNVLVEKPIASTVEEGQRLIDLAREMNRKLMVGHIIRFNPAMQALKARLDAGEVGKIFQIFCRRAGPFPARIRDVGVVVDLAPHDVDIMRFLTGMDPLRVFAETEQRIHTDHEDMLFGLLRFPHGITAALEINWLTPTKIRETLVLGEKGMFRVDDLLQDLYFYENSQATGELWAGIKSIRGVSEGKMIRYDLKRQEPLKAEIQAFLDAVKNDTTVPVTGEDGLKALRLSLALVESGVKHQVIEV
ncbi:Gfo/Idh/MocA family protein [Pelolinea submarina]|uniref:Putative dehydrogenase n=1 Tax=Pelolinea submarina TaxID=913107 RepID=A0A3E0A7N1_9CHLR|nr:Gfo/Idh/MocA family oxidoreductase [Pelolinea submarina]REG06267.1 putative dehydrogenase [Pelolinea submarina]